jgi:hypothetical protein
MWTAILTVSPDTCATIAAVLGGRWRLGLLLAPPAVAFVLLGAGGSRLAAPSPRTLDVQVSATPAGRPLPAAFVGLSIEFPALTAYAGGNPTAINPVFVELVRRLAPGTRPALRIGGRSADATWLPAPGLRGSSAGLRFRLTRGWLNVAHAVASTLDAQLILGVNLARGTAALAGAEANAMLAVIGRRYLDAFEIGNEPDVYNTFAWYRPPRGPALFARTRAWDLHDYLAQFSRWRAALAQLPIAGPAFASLAWMARLRAFLAAEPGLALVTFHQYPLWACQRNPAAPNYPSIPNLLRPSASRGLARQIGPFAALAHRAGHPFRLDELNSAACMGRQGVSDTFATALWSLDTLFALAAAGVDGVNIHTLPGAAYAPFTFSRAGGRWTAAVRPIYYGLLAFVRAFPAGARLLRVRAPGGQVRVWATAAPDGRVRVVLINEHPSTGVTVRLRISGAPTPLGAQGLRAASLQATSGVTLGGAGFGPSTASGVLPLSPGSPPTIFATRRGDYLVRLPAASALLLTR